MFFWNVGLMGMEAKESRESMVQVGMEEWNYGTAR
jgi:hypothetical protein